VWRLPLPAAGVSLQLASGGRWPYGIGHAHPEALAQALAAAGAGAPQPSWAQRHAKVREALRPARLSHPALTYGLLPLALALPAFRVHQHIVYGSTFGEYHAFGLVAYLQAFALWWAAWLMAVVVCAAVLRAAIEGGTWLAVLQRAERAPALRATLEHLALGVLYLGLPAWLAMRVYGL
jgi:apolipoprotein N-acyltransferase